MEIDGSKRFQIQLAKNFSPQNFDQQYYSGYFICNDKLTVVYNDETQKYVSDNSYFGNQIPVVVQITNDGRTTSPIVLKDDLKLEQGFVLYPSLSVQDTVNQLSLLMYYDKSMKIVTMKID